MPLSAAAIAAITGGTQLAGNLIQNSGTKRSQRRADKMNIKFFDMQNAYNSPESQMARLKKAGLNPNLIYGQSVGGATGNSGSAPSASKAAPYSMQGVGQNALAGLQAEAQISNTHMDTIQKSIDAGISKETGMKAAKLELQQVALENTKQYIANTQAAPMVKIKLNQAAEQLAIAGATLKGKQLDNAIKEFNVELTRMNISPTGSIGITLLKMLMQTANDQLNKPFKN